MKKMYVEKYKYQVNYYLKPPSTANYIFNRSTAKKVAVDLGLIIGGAVLSYGLGTIVGELMDNLPYVKDLVPKAIDVLTDIKTAGNLDGLLGLIGGGYGVIISGSEVSENPDYLRSVRAGPINIKLKVPTDEI